MSSQRVRAHLDALRILRRHPDWSDEQVAGEAGIHRLDAAEVVGTARRELVANGEIPGQEAADA